MRSSGERGAVGKEGGEARWRKANIHIGEQELCKQAIAVDDGRSKGIWI